MYENNLRCMRGEPCPKTSDPEVGCGLWWEIEAREGPDKPAFVKRGCGLALLPQLLVEVCLNTNRPASASEEVRDVMLAAVTGDHRLLRRFGYEERSRLPHMGNGE